jgi:hypothetical protein
VTSLFFSGCGQCKPEIKTVYVKSKVPKLRTLYKIKPYEIKDIKSVDALHYLVSKREMEEASKVSKKRIRIINFYEKQNIEFNKKFSTK